MILCRVSKPKLPDQKLRHGEKNTKITTSQETRVRAEGGRVDRGEFRAKAGSPVVLAGRTDTETNTSRTVTEGGGKKRGEAERQRSLFQA